MMQILFVQLVSYSTIAGQTNIPLRLEFPTSVDIGLDVFPGHLRLEPVGWAAKQAAARAHHLQVAPYSGLTSSGVPKGIVVCVPMVPLNDSRSLNSRNTAPRSCTLAAPN